MNRSPARGATVTVPLLAVIVFACNSAPRGPARTPAPVEVREYRGERLSSARDFRENSIKGPQRVDRAQYRLTVGGLVETTRVYSYDEVLRQFSSHTRLVRLYCVEGWDVKILWEGVRVSDLLARAGVRPEARTVIFHAADGYTTSLPLDYVVGRDLLLAYNMNGAELRPERGFPFQLVAEDKWGYKWAKWVTGIELSADTAYRGYWERRGYSNDGDLKRKFFER